MGDSTKSIKIRRKKKGVHEDNRLLKAKKRERLAEIREKQHQALEMRQGGATYDQIAKSLNLIDRSHAKKYVDGALTKFEIEAAKDVVRLDLLRLDEYILRCTHAMRQNGDLNQIDRLLRLMEFRYKLLGINGEDVRALREEHGITNITNNKNTVMVVQASPETEDEFIKKMMSAVGVNPESPQAKEYLQQHAQGRELPMLEGSANETRTGINTQPLSEDEIIDIIDGEVVGEEP